ncbi:alkyl sulfatase BDS1-like metallo-beta-lactamase superfamily hydrolase [Erythromicrobium ramosum]|uniref:Alkyl sulfatase BDS1-like metallo-beta-lactamase superfamily hydrolase n=1 Tax=Erythrobacter ramosus TaxID=35811 RepID=A0A6I4UK54_9SPHN|nr:alkyl sulfatase dimerization domain-containing protein [Erythrobacter ramosus]MBB3775621.1 alkyl sulfatase BDS1-like metallo-beta-lactamase superfamily hydrolase [Erythrobacter ramosus]MXP39280.1 MBL fold metallo-hydrolase [Erythrobacter ramosus]
MTIAGLRTGAALALLMALPCAPMLAAQETPPSPTASEATRAAQAKVAANLPAEGTRDAAFSTRGFLATRTDPVILNAAGKPVWNLAAYAFVTGPAPDTVNPSLWRHMTHLKHHGLYQVAAGVWQVRGFDVSNMTIIRGATGWIVIDPLTSVEAAQAAMELVNATLGKRPVSAMIYSHSHGDHFGGARGVVDPADVTAGRVPVIAPEGFMEEATSENVMAGPAMMRRAAFQFGTGLVPGAIGQMGSGIGMGISAGTLSLIPPTDTVAATGDTRVVDGVALEFQIVSGTEAPAEFNVFIAPEKTFLAAEIATCSFHNILTPRGAKVRDARAWAQYLDEAATRYAPQSDAVISSHCWPIFGREAGTAWLSAQRDNYRWLHDQTVRRMNRGETMHEIAEGLENAAPPGLAAEWSTHGYYGTVSHNAKAVYQFYLGWYDAVPANLHAHPPVERAKRLIEALGGADRTLALAQNAMAGGDYRWASDLLQNLVFAAPDNAAAKAMLANSYQQQGFQAESAIWRNQFLSAASDLTRGRPQASAAQSNDMIAAISTQELLDSAATLFAPERPGRRGFTVAIDLSDRKETAMLEVGEQAIIGRMGALPAKADVTFRGPRRAMLALLFVRMPVSAVAGMEGVTIEGDQAALQALVDALDPMPQGFDIVTP